MEKVSKMSEQRKLCTLLAKRDVTLEKDGLPLTKSSVFPTIDSPIILNFMKNI